MSADTPPTQPTGGTGQTGEHDPAMPSGPPQGFDEEYPDDQEGRWPIDVDPDRPSVARVYDAYLGGGATTQVDRRFASRIRELLPDTDELAVANRRFLARGVTYALERGVDQIVDIGAGVPSIWQTHHVAHALNPACRVVYVDHEAVAYEAQREASAEDHRLGVIRADVRDVDAIVHHPTVERLLDPSRPVVLVMGLLLHFIMDADNPAGLLACYREVVAPGSYLILSHGTADGREEAMTEVACLYERIGRPVRLRTRAELAALLAGYELVAPGIVHMPLWRPTDDDPVVDSPEASCAYAAVAAT